MDKFDFPHNICYYNFIPQIINALTKKEGLIMATQKRGTKNDGTKSGIFNQILKIVGKKNPLAQSILHRICFKLDSDTAIYFLGMVDELGLYEDRMWLLFTACGQKLYSAYFAIRQLWELMQSGAFTQNDIILLKTKEDFDNLVELYGILKGLQN